jgi:hypothetical protein
MVGSTDQNIAFCHENGVIACNIHGLYWVLRHKQTENSGPMEPIGGMPDIRRGGTCDFDVNRRNMREHLLFGS